MELLSILFEIGVGQGLAGLGAGAAAIGAGIGVGNENVVPSFTTSRRRPTQYHLGLFCGIPWSFVVSICH